MRIIFAGTPEFAVAPLRMLLEQDITIAAVYTQPDRPAGRGRKLTPSPVKALANAHGIAVHQPESLKPPDEWQRLQGLKADMMVVVAYGLILPRAVLEIPRMGCINIHASLLPRWRGAAPIQRSILAGDTETGVAIMQIEPKLDAGPVYAMRACPIDPKDTAGDLHDRLSAMGAETLRELLPDFAAGTARAQVQDESGVTYAEKLSKAEAIIDWSRPALELDRQVRAFNPWPVAETLWRGNTLRIWRAQAIDTAADAAPGQLLRRNHTLEVATGDGILRLEEIQLPGGKRISAEAFLNAHPMQSERLGNPV